MNVNAAGPERYEVVNGYALSNGFSDGVGRIRDIELAERLGYARPHDIRKLIKRLLDGRMLCDCEVFATAAKTSPQGGRPTREFWLAEEQALFVIAKSETATATSILKEVIGVFMAWRHGRLPVANDNDDRVVLATLAKTVGILAERIAQIIERQEADGRRINFLEKHIATNGMIAPARLCELRASVRLISRLETESERWSAKKRATADVYRELREVTGWGGKGQPWRELPQHLESKVFPALRNREVEARRALKVRQGEFPFGSN